MPNWCRGTLKVRGKKKNVIEFMLKGLKPVGFVLELMNFSLTIKMKILSL